MKKKVLFVLTIVCILSMTVSAFAASNFTSSPSAYSGGSIASYSNLNGSDSAKPKFTPFSKKDAGTNPNLIAAYNDIVDAEDVADLADGLSDAAQKRNLSKKKLAVSDLFDLDKDGEFTSTDSGFRITYKTDDTDNFVALMVFDADTGDWTIIENAYVDDNGNIVFETNVMGPYAVVVATEDADEEADEEDTPTGDYVMFICAVGICLAATALIVVRFKKNSAR